MHKNARILLIYVEKRMEIEKIERKKITKKFRNKKDKTARWKETDKEREHSLLLMPLSHQGSMIDIKTWFLDAF